MNIQKLFVLAAAALLTACSVNYEGDTPDGNVVAPRLRYSAPANTLATPAADNIALTLSWENGKAPVSNTIELAADKQFAVKYSQPVSKGVTEVSYTFRELNDITMTTLKMKEATQATLYVRVSASLADETVYSNTVEVTVTPGSMLTGAELTCSTTELSLSSSAPNSLALSLSWTRTPNGAQDAIEMSTSAEFLLPYSETMAKGVYDRQYTYAQLNKILTESMGLAAGEEADLYVRVVTSYETSAAYSNTIAVKVIPEAASDNVLYVGGFSAADPWNFDDYLICYNDADKSYCNVHYAKSAWGYKFYPEKNNWDLFYTCASGGTATKGSLTSGGKNNIPAPTDGLYLFDVSLKAYTYNLYSVTSVSYTGFNDDWNLHAMTQSGADPTVFTATVTVTKPATYRWQIIPNGNWDLKLCATGGRLLLYQEGTATDHIDNGTYTLTVDLGKGTYTLASK